MRNTSHRPTTINAIGKIHVPQPVTLLSASIHMPVSDPRAEEISERIVRNPTRARKMPRISSLRSSESRFHEKDGCEVRRPRLERAEVGLRTGVEVFLPGAADDFDRLPVNFELREGVFATEELH